MTLEETLTHPPAESRLEKLPWHLLIDICEWLVQYEPTTKRSLCAFALVSKTCCNATDPQRFRQMHLFVRGPRKLHGDVQTWRHALQVGERMQFLRVVKITGSAISPEAEEQETKAGRDPKQIQRVMQQRRWPGLPDGDEDEEKPRLLSGMDNPLTADATFGSPSTQWPDEQAWQPLVDLFKDLPLLQDVVFASRDQFPRLLLSELHDNHPQSRLHMHYFGLRSLIHPEIDQQAIHPDDMALATSPCLYSIVAVTSPYRRPQFVDYNEEAIMEMASGLAPRLKNVCILQAIAQATRESMWTIPRRPWQGFPSLLTGPDCKQPPKGHVQNLILGTDPGADKLLQWSYRTDFSQLCSLALRSGVGTSTVGQLARLSRQSPLVSLSSLQVNMEPHYAAGEKDSDVDPAVAELLQSLCPLVELMVQGPLREQSFHAVTIHHAEKLRRLTFHGREMEGMEPFVLSPVRAGHLSRRCLQLEELEMDVARMQGDGDEVAVYCCLGRLPRLTCLTLNLHCCVKTILRSDDERDDEVSLFVSDMLAVNGRATVPTLQDAFRDVAVDSNLALSIFGLLGRVNDLRVLKLGLYGLPYSPIGRWLRWVARKWMIRRDAGGDVKIRELEVEEREEALEELQWGAGYAEWHMCKKAWDAVWPPRSEHWWDEWYSVPLKQGSKTQDCHFRYGGK